MEDNYKQFAENLAQQAGKIMKQHFKLGMDRQTKEDSSPVTEADLAINSLVLQQVAERFPEHSVLGEEESNMIAGSEYVWVCDPIDGTIPYSLGLPISTFSLALVHNGESILGVIYDPFCDRMYVAEKGKGAFVNGESMYVSKHNSLNLAILNYELFNHARYDITELAQYLQTQGTKFTRLCSYVLPSALVAAGEFTATIFPHTTAHDAAAVKIIVEEAGGKVTDLFGNDQRYDQPIKGLIASNGHIHEELVILAKKYVKE